MISGIFDPCDADPTHSSPARLDSTIMFTLLAGVLADKVNRQKLVCAINVWLAAMAAGLAVLAWLQMLNPYLILASVFLLGVGFAFNAPAWISIVSQVVSDGE